MATKLAIDGGSKVFENPPQLPDWPPVYPETVDKLREIYLSHAWSFYGPKEVEFNLRFAEYTGAKKCILMANGTVTLETALRAYGIGPGDEVIVPAHTWLATGEAVVFCGATPVVVDIEPDTLCIDPTRIEAAITEKTRAIMPVHLFGSMADMDAIMAIARKHDLKVIEDCAHAHGGFWDGRHVGTIGDVGSFSFQQSKILASGEGGACITNDEEIAASIGRLSHIGYRYGAKQGAAFAKPPAGEICRNYRITDFQAEILMSQLEHLTEDNQLRAENAEYLRRELEAIPGIRVQAPGRKATLQSYYCFAIMVDHNHLKPGIKLDDVIEALLAEGCPICRGWGAPMYKQILWCIPEEMYRISSCEVAEEIVGEELMVAVLQVLMMERQDLRRMVECFAKVMGEYFSA